MYHFETIQCASSVSIWTRYDAGVYTSWITIISGFELLLYRCYYAGEGRGLTVTVAVHVKCTVIAPFSYILSARREPRKMELNIVDVVIGVNYVKKNTTRSLRKT